MNKNANQILLDAANFLEKEDRWSRGTFFETNQSNPDKGCSMCAHGAIIYCGNAGIRELADKNAAAAFAARAAADGATATGSYAASVTGAVYYSNLAQQANLTLPEYILKHYGEVGLAHYKAAKAGLTFRYNDNPSTTKQDVINKLRTAGNDSSA